MRGWRIIRGGGRIIRGNTVLLVHYKGYFLAVSICYYYIILSLYICLIAIAVGVDQGIIYETAGPSLEEFIPPTRKHSPRVSDMVICYSVMQGK